MLLTRARIRGYRSIKDTGYFDVEDLKTILVGPNESGKTAILQALQKLNKPDDVADFNPLRDYPRSEYSSDIVNGGIDKSDFGVVEGIFKLSDKEQEEVPKEYRNLHYHFVRNLDNSSGHWLSNVPEKLKLKDIEQDLIRLSSHIQRNIEKETENKGSEKEGLTIKEELEDILSDIDEEDDITTEIAGELKSFFKKYLVYIDEEGKEYERYQNVSLLLKMPSERYEVLNYCSSNIPKFILFNNYFRVRPSIHLKSLSERIRTNSLDDKQYDYGNVCLLKLLGFTAEELAEAGKAEPQNTTPKEIEKYKDILDNRDYQLNAASIRLTEAIKEIWNPKEDSVEASRLIIKVDGQYLKVVVEDSMGVEVELDQRSEGFQWMVSFFIVFFAEATDKHKNAILLLDEPGLSLHGLKQIEFRKTLTKLSEENQTLYTTHSPFLVGPDELDIVRVVEMQSREEGTKVHTSVSAGDSAALLSLQEALGYDLAQTLFVHEKNLVLEGLTDYWYLDVVSQLAKESGIDGIDEKIALNPANSAGKVVYYATILHAQNFKVAALLDSDSAGDNAAKQDTLVNALGNKRILRTKDFYRGKVNKPEIEDLFRDTLVNIAKEYLQWDVLEKSEQQVGRPIIDIFEENIENFSKYKLAKAFINWSKDHKFEDLKENEREASIKLIKRINNVLDN